MVRPQLRNSQFFDVNSLTTRWERDFARAMKRVGALVRREGQDTMPRIVRTVSRPGEPPHRHKTTKHSLRNIQFDYEPRNKGVVVGPVHFQSGDTPHLIEFGGVKVRRRAGGRSRRMRYRKRPFMAPSLEKVRKENGIPRQFRNVITE